MMILSRSQLVLLKSPIFLRCQNHMDKKIQVTHTAQLTYRYLGKCFKGINPPELPQKDKRSMTG